MEWFQGPLKEWLTDTVHSSSFQQPIHWDIQESKAITDRLDQDNWTVGKAGDAWKYINAQLVLNG
jgi:hypothetical protein